MTERKPIYWLSDDDYAKAIGQFRLQLNGVFGFITDGVHYGFRDEMHREGGALDVVVRLAEDLALRVRGVDKPIDYNRAKRKRRGK